MPVTRLGVAGLGWLGESLIKDAVRLPEFEVVAVQDVVPERPGAIAAEYGAGWCGQRFDDLLAVPEVEAVVICTPNHLHAAQAQAALAAGKDVLVQKPLALSATDARLSVRRAQAVGRLLFVDYTYRFLPTMRAFREALGGQRIRSMRAMFHNIYGPGPEKRWFFDPATAGGGALMDLGVHLLDLGLWLAQADSAVLTSAELSEERPVEQSARLQLLLGGDMPFEVAVSWNAGLAASAIGLEVDTADGRLRWENVDGSFFRFRTVLQDGRVVHEQETTLREDTLRAFAAALADRANTPTVDIRVYEVLDQAYGRA